MDGRAIIAHMRRMIAMAREQGLTPRRWYVSDAVWAALDVWLPADMWPLPRSGADRLLGCALVNTGRQACPTCGGPTPVTPLAEQIGLEVTLPDPQGSPS